MKPTEAPATSFDDVVLGRRSIRGYKADPVPKTLIGEVIEMAMRASSSLNTQPWNHGAYAGAHRERRIEIAKQLFIAMGFPDDTFPANPVVSRRKSVGDAAVFVGFDE